MKDLAILAVFLLMTLADPVVHDQELAEYVFVTFGCFLYLSSDHILKNTLFEVGSQGNYWSMDLLMSVTSFAAMAVQEGSTLNTVFHVLAKKQHLDLLQYILLLGYVPVLIDVVSGERLPACYNKEGTQFTYYIQDPIKRQSYESRFVDYFDTQFKQVVAARRETGELNPPPMTRHLDRFRSQEETLSSSLQREAREETVKDLKTQLKKGKSRNKSQAIVREVTKEDEEKAKQAEQELLAMLEKDEIQSGKGKEKAKKKHSK
jgi:hypothetical protein